MDPPEAERSDALKSVEGSLNMNVSTAVSPALRLVLLLPTITVGRRVSTFIVTVLFVSAPSSLKLPAALENTLLPTLITPFAVLSAVGVNVAV